MASRLEIIVSASDQATRTFQRVAASSGKAMEGINKNAQPLKRQMQQVFEDIEDKAGDSFRNISAVSQEELKKFEKASADATRAATANFNKMKAETSDPINWEIKLESSEAQAEALGFMGTLKAIPSKTTVDLALEGTKFAREELKNLNAQLLSRNLRDVTYNVTTEGVKESTKALLGLQRDGFGKLAKKTVLDIVTRGADMAARHIGEVADRLKNIDTQSDTARKEIERLTKRLNQLGTMDQTSVWVQAQTQEALLNLKLTRRELQELDDQRAEPEAALKNYPRVQTTIRSIQEGISDINRSDATVMTYVQNAKTVFGTLEKIYTDARKVDKVDPNITFRMTTEGSDDVIEETLDVNEAANRISQNTIKYLMKVIGDSDVLNKTREINRKANDSIKDLQMKVETQGVPKVLNDLVEITERTDGIDGRMAEVYARLQDTEILNDLERLKDEIGEVTEEQRIRFFSNASSVSDDVDDLAKNVASLTVRPSSIMMRTVGTFGVLSSLGRVKEAAKNVGLTPAEVTVVTTGIDAAVSGSMAVVRALKRIPRDKRIALELQDRGVPDRLQEVYNRLVEVEGVDPEIALKMIGEKPVSGALDGLWQRIKRIDGRSIVATVGLMGAGVVADRLAYVGEAIDYVSNKNAEPRVGLAGALSTLTQLGIIEAFANRLDGRSVNMSLDAKGAILLPKILGDSLHMLMQFQTVTAVISAVKMPAMIGAIGGVITALGGLAGAAASAAFQLGSALAGAFGAVGGAAGLSLGAVLGYGAAVKGAVGIANNLNTRLAQQESSFQSARAAVIGAEQALKEAKPGTVEYEQATASLAAAEANLVDEQRKLALIQATATPQMKSLSETVRAAQLEYAKFGAAIASAAVPAIEKFISVSLSNLPKIQPHLVEMIEGMNGVSISFLEAASNGERLGRVQTILMGVKNAGVPAMTMLTNAVNIFIDAFSVVVPTASKVNEALAAASESAARWTNSAEGQKRMGSIWSAMVGQAQALGKSLVNLGAGFYNIGLAIQKSGLGGGLLSGLVSLTQKFRETTAVGSEGFQKLTRFFTAMNPVLSAMGGVVAELARQVLRVAFAIGTAGQKSGEMNPLVSVLNGIERSLVHIGDLIIYNMVEMGPRIGPLIENLAKLASVFMAALAPMLLFLDGFNWLMQRFTALDPVMQKTLVGIVSWGAVISMVGSGPLAFFARRLAFLSSMLTGPFIAAAKVFDVAMKVVGSAFTVVTYAAFPLLGKLASLSGLFAVITGPIGLTAAAIGGAVLAFGALVLAGGRIHEALTTGERSFNSIGEAASFFGNQLKNGVLDKAQALKSWWDSSWPDIKDTMVSALTAGASVVVPVFGALYENINRIANNIRASVSGMFSNVGGGDGGGALQSLQKMFDGISKWAASNGPKIKSTIDGIFSGLGKIIGGIVSSAGPAFSKFLSTIATLFGKLASGVKAVMPSLLQFAGGVLAGIAKGVGGLIEKALPVFVTAFSDIAAGVSNAMPGLKILGIFVGSVLKGAFDSLWPIVKVVAAILGGLFLAAVAGAGKAIKGLGTVIGWIGNALEPLTPIIKGLGYIIGYVFSTVIVSAVTGGIGAIAKFLGWMPKIIAFGARFKALTAIFNFFKTSVQIVNSAVSILAGVVFRQVLMRIGPISKAVGFLKNAFGAVASTISNAVSSAFKGFVGIIDNIIGRFANFSLSGAIREFNLFGLSGRSVVKGLQSVLSGIKNFITGLPGLGREMLKGLRDGIVEVPGAILKAFIEICTNAYNGLKEWWGIASPSKKMAEIGRFLIQGLVSGVVALASSLWNTVRKMASDVTNGLKTAWAGVGPATKTVWNGVVNAVKTAFAVVKSVVSIGSRLAASVFKVQFQGFLAVVNFVMPTISRAVRTGLNDVQTIIKTAMKILGPVIKLGFTGFVVVIKAAFLLIKAATTVTWRTLVAIIRGAVLAVKNLVVPTFRAVGAGVKAAWSVIGPVAKAAWNGVVQIVKTAMAIFVPIIKKNFETVKAFITSTWNIIKITTSRVWTSIKVFFGGVWKVIKGIFSGNTQQIREGLSQSWSAMRAGATAVWNAIRTMFRNTWTAIKTIFTTTARGIGDALKTAWNGMVNAIKNFITNVTSAVRNFLTNLKNRFRTEWESIRKSVTSISLSLATALSERYTAMYNRAKEFLTNLWNNFKSGWDRIRSTVTTIARNLGTDISNRWTAMYDRGKEAVTNLYNMLRDRWTYIKNKVVEIGRSLASGLSNLWSGMYDRAERFGTNLKTMLGDKFAGVVNGVRKYLGLLATALANVLEAIGMDDLAGKLNYRAKSLNTPVRFAKGGVLSYAGGGVEIGDGGGAYNGSRIVAITNEAGPEAIVPLNKKTKTGMQALNVAASAHKMSLVPNSPDKFNKHYHGPPTVRERFAMKRAGVDTMAEGGVSGKGWTDNLNNYPSDSRWGNNFVGKVANLVAKRIGSSPSTYAGHEPDQYHAIDFMQQNRADQPGDTIADFLYGNYNALGVDYLIWKQRFKAPYSNIYGAGGQWSSVMPNRGSDTQNHFDHVHASFKNAPGSGEVSSNASYQGGGGSGFFGSVKDAFGNVWNSVTDFMAKYWKPPSIPSIDLGIVGEGITKFLGSLAGKAKDWVMEKASSSLGFGGGSSGGGTGNGSWSGGGTVKEWIADGLKFGGVFPATTDNINKMYGRVMQESGGNPNAVNNWDSNAAKGTPSKGLVQIIGPTWESWRNRPGPDAGSFDSNWMNPIKSVAVSSRYMKGAYGYLVGSNGQGYAEGGIVPGAKGAAKTIKAHAGERVLPRNAVAAFDKMASAIREATRDRRSLSSVFPSLQGLPGGNLAQNIVGKVKSKLSGLPGMPDLSGVLGGKPAVAPTNKPAVKPIGVPTLPPSLPRPPRISGPRQMLLDPEDAERKGKRPKGYYAPRPSAPTVSPQVVGNVASAGREHRTNQTVGAVDLLASLPSKTPVTALDGLGEQIRGEVLKRVNKTVTGATDPYGFGATVSGATQNIKIDINQDFSGMKLGEDMTEEDIVNLSRKAGEEAAQAALAKLGNGRHKVSSRIASRRS